MRVDVAIVEDDADQCALLARIIERAGFSVARARSVEGGEALIKNESPKILLCDFDLPDGTGVDLCKSARKFSDRSSCYLMLISSSTSCDLSAEVLNAGADDYLKKPVIHDELISRVRVGMRMSCMHEQLRAAAVTDGLTGLYNHDHFNRLLESEMERSRRYGNPLALIMVDMDHFKAINDAYGHLAGNATLEAVAKVIRAGIREIDTPARFGGEEFTIILPEARAVDAIQVAERIRARTGSGQHGDDDRSDARATRLRVVVVALTTGDRADDQPDHEHDSEDPHSSLRSFRGGRGE
ncbi:MAG: diguanylate cyclase, partial [Planctomycetes bacterium]|nr:diguanylate cyclase [Planctomycetota bacterium]